MLGKYSVMTRWIDVYLENTYVHWPSNKCNQFWVLPRLDINFPFKLREAHSFYLVYNDFSFVTSKEFPTLPAKKVIMVWLSALTHLQKKSLPSLREWNSQILSSLENRACSGPGVLLTLSVHMHFETICISISSVCSTFNSYAYK